MVELLREPVTRTSCDSSYGWMPNGYQKHIRETMTRYLETWALGEHQPLSANASTSQKAPPKPSGSENSQG